MTTLLGIDPGADTGWALLVDGTLKYCGLGWDFPCANVALIERPKIHGKSNPVDIITLAIRVGELKHLCEVLNKTQVLFREPVQWKGTMDKTLHNTRVLAGLTALEKAIYLQAVDKIPKSKHNNVIDAIGLAQSLNSTVKNMGMDYVLKKTGKYR